MTLTYRYDSTNTLEPIASVYEYNVTNSLYILIIDNIYNLNTLYVHIIDSEYYIPNDLIY